MITVYFESKSHSEKVATFVSEELYMLCLPALEKKAKEARMIVTESEDEMDVCHKCGHEQEHDEEFNFCKECLTHL